MRMRKPRITPLLVGAVVLGVAASWPVPASAQTPYVPYFGKNRVRYDRFQWSIYKTDHFEIYFYPETKPQLERVAAYAESAYQHVSATLKHDLADKVPLIIYKTESEFQEQNVSGGELPEGVLAFAEPERNRMVLPIDEPSDRLYQLITHELTHIFEFDIIPRGIGLVQALPLWMDEGLSDYMTGSWNTLDLMQVRDAALTDNVPKMSEMESAPLSGRLPYSLGHATFEFIEARWGLDGLRQFLFSLRKSVIGGGDSAYEEALKLKPEEFDEQFDRYLKARFKPFRDKERPADYGRDLAPRPDKTDYVSVVSIDPSPTGDIIAAVVGNRHDEELDIILISAKDGQVIRNLTSGFDKDRGWEYIAAAGGLRGNLVPWIGWAPVGDRLAYFVRTEKEKTLVVQNVVTGKVEEKIDLKVVDEPESPAFSPDGQTIVFSALQAAVTDIFTVDLKTRQIKNVTQDAVADYAPTYSLDGKTIVYSTHVSGNDKLFSVDLGVGQEDPAHVRHARRHEPEVLRRPYDHLHVDRGRPEEPAATRGRAQRRHPECVVARSEIERAEAVDRHGHGQRVAGRPPPNDRPADRVRLVLQERQRHPSHLDRQANRDRRDERLRLARSGRRLPAAAEPHAVARQHSPERPVGEDVA